MQQVAHARNVQIVIMTVLCIVMQIWPLAVLICPYVVLISQYWNYSLDHIAAAAGAALLKWLRPHFIYISDIVLYVAKMVCISPRLQPLKTPKEDVCIDKQTCQSSTALKVQFLFTRIIKY